MPDMLYHLTTAWVRPAFSVYFRRMYLSNRHLIPAGKPVILAANHPSAFIEPVILACKLERTLHFMARGDFYLNSPFMRRLYDTYNLIPVFRLDDAGYGQLKTNYSSFERCFSVLKDNGALMILAEGRTKHEKRLRKVMKGTARIAFGTMEFGEGLDICIVPVGVNYTNSDQFRSDVMIDFGPPVSISDYLSIHGESPSRAVNLLTAEIEKRLSERVIHIEDPADDELAEMLLELKREELKKTAMWRDSGSAGRLREEKEVADAVNCLPGEEKEALKEALGDYFHSLRQQGVSDSGLTGSRGSNIVLDCILLVVAWGLGLPGLLLNALPMLLGTRAARKLAKTIEFRASLIIAFSSVVYLPYLLAFVVAGIVTGEARLLIFLAVAPLTGMLAVKCMDWQSALRERIKAGAMSKAAAGLLMGKRAAVLGMRDRMVGGFTEGVVQAGTLRAS